MSTQRADGDPANAEDGGAIDDDAVTGEGEHLPSPRLATRMAALRGSGARLSLIGVWLAMIAVYIVAVPGGFTSGAIWQTIFGSQQALVFLSLALLCTICVGEFVDLSVASVFALAAMLVPVLTVLHGWDVWLASLVAILAATLAGAVNGLLVVFLGVNTIVVTLGMGTLLLGVTLWMSNLSQVSGLSAGYGEIALHRFAGLPLTFYYGLAVAALFAYVIGYTPLGRHMRFVGAGHEVSRLAGIRVRRIRIGSFVIAGFLCGLGGILSAASLGGFNPSVSQSYLLPTFAATFLGTSVIEPGRFNPLGTWIATYFLATGILGLELLGAQAWVSDVFYGGILVAAVSVSTLLRRRIA